MPLTSISSHNNHNNQHAQHAQHTSPVDYYAELGVRLVFPIASEPQGIIHSSFYQLCVKYMNYFGLQLSNMIFVAQKNTFQTWNLGVWFTLSFSHNHEIVMLKTNPQPLQSTLRAHIQRLCQEIGEPTEIISARISIPKRTFISYSKPKDHVIYRKKFTRPHHDIALEGVKNKNIVALALNHTPHKTLLLVTSAKNSSNGKKKLSKQSLAQSSVIFP